MHPPLRPPEFQTWQMTDGYELRGRVWRPSAASSGTPILYLHGIQSHGGWFEWSASLLAETGALVMLPDRRGSGLNERERGDVSHRERWLNDVDELAEWTTRQTDSSAMRVVGVSWGGKLAAAWAMRRHTQCDALLLIAPGIYPAVDVGWRNRLRIASSLLTQPTRTFPIPLSDPALFTANPNAQGFIRADGLKLERATAKFLYESSRLDREVRRPQRGNALPRTTIMLAERDSIIENEKVIAWSKLCPAAAMEAHVVRNSCHTLEFEEDRREFGERIRTWAKPPGCGGVTKTHP